MVEERKRRRGREAGRKEIRQRKTERCKRAQKLRLRSEVIRAMQHNIITGLLLGLGIENPSGSDQVWKRKKKKNWLNDFYVSVLEYLY